MGGARVHVQQHIQGSTKARFKLAAPLGSGMPLSGISVSGTGFTPPRTRSLSPLAAVPTIQEVYNSAFYEMAPFLKQRLSRYFESLGKFRFAEARADITQPVPAVWSPSNKFSILLNVDPRHIRQLPRRSRTSRLLRMSRKMFWQQISTPLALLAECERIYYGMYYVTKTRDATLHEKYMEVKERLSMISDCLGGSSSGVGRGGGSGEKHHRSNSSEPRTAAGKTAGKTTGKTAGTSPNKRSSPSPLPQQRQSTTHNTFSPIRSTAPVPMSPPSSSSTMMNAVMQHATTPTPTRRRRNGQHMSSSSYTSDMQGGFTFNDEGNANQQSPLSPEEEEYNNASPFPPTYFLRLVIDLSILIQLRISTIATYKALKYNQHTPSAINYVELRHAMSSLTEKTSSLQSDNYNNDNDNDNDDTPRSTTASTISTATPPSPSSPCRPLPHQAPNIMTNVIHHTTYEVSLLHKCFTCQTMLRAWQFIQTTKHLYEIKKILKRWRLMCNATCNGIEPPSLMWLEQLYHVLMAKTTLYYQSIHRKIQDGRNRRPGGGHQREEGTEEKKEGDDSTTKQHRSSTSSSSRNSIGSTRPMAVSPRRAMENAYQSTTNGGTGTTNMNSYLNHHEKHTSIDSINNMDTIAYTTEQKQHQHQPFDDSHQQTTMYRIERMLQDIVKQDSTRNGLKAVALIVLELEHPGGRTTDTVHQYDPVYGYTPNYVHKGNKNNTRGKHRNGKNNETKGQPTTNNKQQRTLLDMTMARYFNEEEQKRQLFYVGIRSAPIIYVRPNHQSQLLKPYVPNITSLSMSTMLEEPVAHVYAPPPQDFVKHSGGGGSGGSGGGGGGGGGGAGGVQKPQENNDLEQHEENASHTAAFNSIANSSVPSLNSTSTNSSSSSSSSSSGIVNDGESTTAASTAPTMTVPFTTKEMGVHYYSVKIENNMTLIVLEIPDENSTTTATAATAAPVAPMATDSGSNAKETHTAFESKGGDRPEDATVVKAGDKTTAAGEEKESVPSVGGAFPTTMATGSASTSPTTTENEVPPLTTTATMANDHHELPPLASALGPPPATGTSSSKWYSSVNGRRSTLKARQSKLQQEQEEAMKRILALKQPNPNINQKMQSIANVLQHRLLMEELGPAASDISLHDEFRLSVLSAVEGGNILDEPSGRKDSCVIL